MFRFYFPIGILFHAWVVTFVWPPLFELSGVIKNGTHLGFQSKQYKYKFYGNFFRVPFPLPHWFGVGNVIMTPDGRVAWHLWPSNDKPSLGVMPGHGCCDVAVKVRARRGTVVERAGTSAKLR